VRHALAWEHKLAARDAADRHSASKTRVNAL
jgi:hypothetical protein